MTVARLASLLKCRRRCFALSKRISTIKDTNSIVSDFVFESRHDIRGDWHMIAIHGRDPEKLKADMKRYLRERDRYQRKVDEIECWIKQIDDIDAKSVFELRYIEGLKWQEIALALWPNEIREESYPRRQIHDAYLKAKGIT
jgi:hypothetical protein